MAPTVMCWQQWLPSLVQDNIALRRYVSEGDLIEVAGGICGDGVDHKEDVIMLQCGVGMVVDGLISSGAVRLCKEDSEEGRWVRTTE